MLMLPAIVLFVLTYVLMLLFSKARPCIALASGVLFVVFGMLPVSDALGTLDFNVLLMIGGTMGLVLGAVLFAGALADGGSESWPGLIGGAICAALGWRAVGDLIERTRARLQGGAAALLSVYADAVALVLAAIAIAVTTPVLGSSSIHPLATRPPVRFWASTLADVDALVMPEQITANATRNVTKWMPNALCV